MKSLLLLVIIVLSFYKGNGLIQVGEQIKKCKVILSDKCGDGCNLPELFVIKDFGSSLIYRVSIKGQLPICYNQHAQEIHTFMKTLKNVWLEKCKMRILSPHIQKNLFQNITSPYHLSKHYLKEDPSLKHELLNSHYIIELFYLRFNEKDNPKYSYHDEMCLDDTLMSLEKQYPLRSTLKNSKPDTINHWHIFFVMLFHSTLFFFIAFLLGKNKKN